VPPDPDTSVHFYPEDIERRWVAAAQALAPRSTENETIDRLADTARQLSNLFTTERPAVFPDYAASLEARIAYGVLFFPQTWTRTRFALAEAIETRGVRPTDGDFSILDLGAGTGAAGWSAAQMLVARGLCGRVRLTSVDRSKAALDAIPDTMTRCPSAARAIHVETHEADVVEFVAASAARRASFDVVVVSFALNEAFAPSAPSASSAPPASVVPAAPIAAAVPAVTGVAVASPADAAPNSDDAARAWLRDVAGLLRPNGLLVVIEPALRETATRLRDLARPLVAAGKLSVLAPDLDGTIGAPPADARFFDHEVRRWHAPASLSRLNLKLRRSLNELTFSFLVLSPTAPTPFPPAPRRARLTSPIARMKGRKAFTAIEANAGSERRATFDILDRTLDDDAEALLLSIERGDHVEISDAAALREPGWWRIAGPAAVRVAWRPT
jgi:SAM-dependent methyltransferase